MMGPAFASRDRTTPVKARAAIEISASFLKSFVYKIPAVSKDFFHGLHEELPVVA